MPRKSTPKCSKKRRSSVASVALTTASGYFLERHGVVVQDAALADLVARRVEELDAVAAGEEAAFVEFHEGGERKGKQDEDAAEAKRETFGGGLVQKAPPAGETEAGKEARAGVPVVLDARPALGERGIDPGIEAQPVDVLAFAAPEEPVTQGLRLNCRAALKTVGLETRARQSARERLKSHAIMVIYTAFAGSRDRD